MNMVYLFYFYTSLSFFSAFMHLLERTDTTDDRWFLRVLAGIVCYGIAIILSAIERKK